MNELRKELLFILGGVFVFMSITMIVFNAFPVFITMEGQGIVVKRMNRSGSKSGLWVQVEDGTEIRLPPTKLWDMIKEGDYIKKEKYSFIYRVNERSYNAIFYMLRSILGTWLIISGFFIIIRLVQWNKKRSSLSDKK